MAGGLGLEALADKQKSDFKALAPNSFCNVGVYGSVRCPNYLGEILFWMGNWVLGIPVYTGWFHWVVSLVGVACIVLIMIGSTKRLEEKQGERYGGLADYQAYIRTISVLIPFVPVYTLKNVRVYLE
jgi:steroid 5-alpha reductase family enzyme